MGTGTRRALSKVCDENSGVLNVMIILGLILLLLGFVLGVPLLWTIGIIVLIIGLVLLVAGQAGRQIGGRSHYW